MRERAMDIRKKATGIRWLIGFYCFIIFQDFMMRSQFKMNTGVEAVFIGTLIYLVIGYITRSPAARWTGMVFHGVFQLMETSAVVFYANPKAFQELAGQIPANMSDVARVSLVVVFLLITAINVAAIVYLWKRSDYFEWGRGAEKQTEA
jgi:hypothetical protein